MYVLDSEHEFLLPFLIWNETAIKIKENLKLNKPMFINSVVKSNTMANLWKNNEVNF